MFPRVLQPIAHTHLYPHSCTHTHMQTSALLPADPFFFSWWAQFPDKLRAHALPRLQAPTLTLLGQNLAPWPPGRPLPSRIAPPPLLAGLVEAEGVGGGGGGDLEGALAPGGPSSAPTAGDSGDEDGTQVGVGVSMCT